METNPYEPPETKNVQQGPSTGRRVLVGCGVAAAIGLAAFIAFFTICTALMFTS